MISYYEVQNKLTYLRVQNDPLVQVIGGVIKINNKSHVHQGECRKFEMNAVVEL